MTPADRERTIPVLLEVMPARHLHLIRDDTVGIDKRSLYLAKGRPEQVKKALIKEIPVPVQESLDDVELRARRGSMRYRCVVLNVIQFTDRNDSQVPSRFFRKLIEAASAPPCSSPPPSCSARPSPPASTCPGTSSCPIRAPRCTSASPSPASGPSCRPGRSLRLSSSA